MGKLLFGLELELGFSAGAGPRPTSRVRGALAELLDVCARGQPYLTGGDSRLYLPNGSMIYPDCGHPELATAESRSPHSLLMSLRAGEVLLTQAAQELQQRSKYQNVRLYRTNVDYSSPETTWGSHESYLSPREPVKYARAVVPHLASRIIYSGSGGFNNRSQGALFCLSPRVFHLTKPVGTDTGGRRAIFSLRNESLAGPGYHRVHLVCGETTCSELGTYLKVGATALVLAMAAHGIIVDDGVRLKAPLEAMQMFTLDTACRKRVQTTSGRWITAIDIQKHYLKLAESNSDASYMPDWASELCARWREVLDRLENNPESLARALDWPIKLAIFKDYVRSHSSLRWEALPIWSSVLTRVGKALNEDQPFKAVDYDAVKQAMDKPGPLAKLLENLSLLLTEHGLDWEELEPFQKLRSELCELDTRYGQLWPAGILLSMDEAGVLNQRILEKDAFRQALDRAPEPGRARIRGDCIRRLVPEKDSYFCNWAGIRGAHRTLDLNDPFVQEEVWTEHAKPEPRDPGQTPLILRMPGE